MINVCMCLHCSLPLPLPFMCAFLFGAIIFKACRLWNQNVWLWELNAIIVSTLVLYCMCTFV